MSADRYDGAIYLGGYVVELALKNRICVVLNWKGFPQTAGEFQNYKSFKTHNLDVLLSLSGVESKINSSICEWSPLPLGTRKRGIIQSVVQARRC